jgi:hypothetical protein
MTKRAADLIDTTYTWDAIALTTLGVYAHATRQEFTSA